MMQPTSGANPTASLSRQTAAERSSEREIVRFALLVLGLALLLSVLSLETYPDLHPDEAWYANLAKNWIETGDAWTTIDVGPYPDGRGQRTTTLGAVPTRVAVQVWGVSLRSVRLVSYVGGLAVLLAVAVLGRQLWSLRVGALAALFLALTPLFLAGSHIGRPEIWVALAAVTALSASVRGWQTRQPRWDVLGALLAIVSVEFHQNGAVFAVALASTYAARYGRSLWRRRSALAFFGISAVGGAAYLVRQRNVLLPGGTDGTGGLGIAASHALPVLSENPLIWIFREFSRYVRFAADDQLGALLIALALALAWHRSTAADRVTVSWLVGAALAMMLLVSRRFELYVLPMLCVAAVLVGRGFAEVLDRFSIWGRRAVFATLAVMLVPSFTLAVTGLGQDPTDIHRTLRATVPCERILAPNVYWLGFTDCDFRSFDQINHYHHAHGLTVSESMAEIRPAYLIIDRTVEDKLGEDFGAGGDMGRYYSIPRDEFEQFLDQHTTLVELIPTADHGTIQVRRVTLEEAP